MDLREIIQEWAKDKNMSTTNPWPASQFGQEFVSSGIVCNHCSVYLATIKTNCVFINGEIVSAADPNFFERLNHGLNIELVRSHCLYDDINFADPFEVNDV